MCKFYQGAEDKVLEMRLKKVFEKVHREKPESSRKVRFTAYTLPPPPSFFFPTIKLYRMFCWVSLGFRLRGKRRVAEGQRLIVS